ncbi:MAG: prolyl oligopeptidase family serine peptidase [Gemmatimonadetes bacterium]|jgi:dipeptidyl aminopeptidase/acylaminoacyl peptidase|nr:prolyl oligopeptidase family serine peptidase [Gemmatimonadota bacterium]MBT4613426.1 prolyl oligopeptidase family serine peptidase [Gemmatimonadota bacterium]MBT5060609.1 prolyl oligopeptidase family serine peptidase [Gemmatimonadota bacterium]MBT5141631.1 prolyl oligopeptidase family serine peptidase [Gemmatimonadota bacterium]MBT5590934.1 prolyl oligopeptidase family serine peptidase [Gemmatimonadota bacterium]
MADRSKILVTSTMDGTDQPSYLTLPANFDAHSKPAGLVVSLHPWSSGLEGGRSEDLEALVYARGWIYLWPHFRGCNNTPQALGSHFAQQDILDALASVQAQYPIDTKRIFLTGISGGGHMTMLMASRYPDQWTAAAAWVGISDLTDWYATHKDGKYGEMMRQCLGGAPGDSEAIDVQLQARSPITHLANAKDVALEIAAGRHDGFTGSVPIRQSLHAFNVIAAAAGAELISDAEIEQMSRPDAHLDNPTPSDQITDASYATQIFLRRQAARARVTIFEGGHEGIATATMAWFQKNGGARGS